MANTSDPSEFDIDRFGEDLACTLKRGREAFNGRYKIQLTELSGLSASDIQRCTTDIMAPQKYNELLLVVQEASRVNLAQAELKNKIEQLGAVAVEIAKEVPSLSAIIIA